MRPVTPLSVSQPHAMYPPFMPLELACDDYDPSLTYTSDDVVLFRNPLLAFFPMDTIAVRREPRRI